jgi:hypothetical protein
VSQLKQPQQNNPAFVLGNGTSRLAVEPTSLLDQGTVYGCNAQYREYDPHHLIAVDVKMVNEIIAAGYHTSHSVWTNPNKGVSTKANINFFQPHKGWSSGPTALWHAATNGHREIYILGFDYQGLNGKFNNVYADTFNYKKSSDNATFHGNWLSQTEKVIKEFKNIQFYRVLAPQNFIPPQLLAMGNLKHIYYDEFIEQFQLNKKYENDQKTII